MPDSSAAAATALRSMAAAVPAEVNSTVTCARRCHSDGPGIPPRAAIFSPRKPAAASSRGTLSAGRLVRDSTLSAPTTVPSQKIGEQASAVMPWLAAMKSGRTETSGTKSLTPETTTLPMTPLPGLNPSTTWK